MEKRIKQIVSAAGLASVALITGVTYALPNANAESGISGTVDVTVTVINDSNTGGGGGSTGSGSENAPAADISNIKEGSTITSPSLDVKISYKNAKSIEYTLTQIDAKGKKHVYKLDTYQTPTANGVHEWTLNLAQYGYGSFTLKASVNGAASATDTVKFRYNEVDITDTNQTNSAGNPIITTNFGELSTKVCYDVYYTGNKKKGDGTLVMKGICHNLTTSEIEAGYVDFALPFNSPEYKDKIKAGNYRVVATSYSASGVVLGIDQGRLSNFVIPNTGDDLNVPDTGGNFIATLNLSRADYILSGLVIFGFVTIFALRFVTRANRARSYKRR